MRDESGNAGASDRAMQEWICRENIDNLRGQLARTRDDNQRDILSKLLGEELEKLAKLKAASKN